jgi:hypothetical protein
MTGERLHWQSEAQKQHQSEQHPEGIHISMPLLSGDISLSFSLDLEFLTMHYIFTFSHEETLC